MVCNSLGLTVHVDFRISQPSQACRIPLYTEHPDLIAEPMISSEERPENGISQIV